MAYYHRAVPRLGSLMVPDSPQREKTRHYVPLLEAQSPAYKIFWPEKRNLHLIRFLDITTN